MKIYRVGGSVRDELLGRPGADRDWVVVGATPEMMIASGFRPVGRDFPVFLHPETHEEYALARTERKHGRGYRGFEFFASPDVTLEEDLARRDLTINAMARAEDGTLIDPFGGAADLRAGVLRHVSPAFAEDPLRVLRVARFAARFGFAVAPETEALMRALAASGELATLAPERVWQELARGLMEPHPSRMLAVLRECGALAQLLPEVDALFGVPQPPRTIRRSTPACISRARSTTRRRKAFALPVALRGARARSRQGGDRRAARWPDAPRHEARSVRLAERDVGAAQGAARLPRRGAARGALARRRPSRARELRPATLLDLLTAADALRRPERLDALLDACAVRRAVAARRARRLSARDDRCARRSSVVKASTPARSRAARARARRAKTRSRR